MKCPISAAPKDTLTSVGLLLIRLFLGVGLAAHGYTKFFGEGGVSGFAGFLTKMEFPLPTVLAYLSAGTELFCGALIALGLLTRLAAIPMVINMLVAAFTMHGHAYFSTTKSSAGVGGMEYALNLAVIFAALMLTGAGNFSVDHCMSVRCAKKQAKS